MMERVVLQHPQNVRLRHMGRRSYIAATFVMKGQLRLTALFMERIMPDGPSRRKICGSDA